MNTRNTNNSSSDNDKLRIAIITSLQGGDIGQGQIKMLRRFPDILGDLCSDIYIVSGWKLFDAINKPLTTGTKKSSMLVTSLKYIPSNEIGTSISLARILGKVDIVVFFLSAPSVFPTLLAKLARKKTLFMLTGLGSKEVELKIHNNVPRQMLTQLYKTLETICFSLVDNVAAESENILHFHNLDKYASKFVVFGADYIDTSAFKSDRPLSDRKYDVGYIGRFSSEKGITNFIEAVASVLQSHSDLSILVAGDGILRNEIEDQIRKRKIENNITLTGWVPHDEISNYLNELKLVVSPSLTEGLPPLVQEAMACGTPVLATPVGGIPDLITDSITGFIMENNSPLCIAENIIRSINHPKIEEISRNAQAAIAKEYTREILSSKYYDTLSYIIGQGTK